MGSLISPRMFGLLAAFYPSLCTIQAPTETQDAAGQPIPSWTNLPGHVALSCRMSPTGGGERKTPSQIYSVGVVTINLQEAYPLITTKMRAVVDNVVYDILSVDIDGNNVSTRLTCQVVD